MTFLSTGAKVGVGSDCVAKLEDDKSSVINIVGNKINLLSHNGSHTFELTNPEKLITEEEQEKINSSAHPIAYGDTLVEFLEL